jgi:hypothetical protein
LIDDAKDELEAIPQFYKWKIWENSKNDLVSSIAGC